MHFMGVSPHAANMVAWSWLRNFFVLGTLGFFNIASAVEYTVGIARQQAASELAKRWVPIIKYWSDESGLAFQFRTAKDIDTFQTELGDGRYDIMFVNAHHYTVYNRAPGYVAFAQEKGCMNGSVIVVAQSNAVRSVKELEGATIAFSSPNAVVGTWLPVQHLRQQGVAFATSYVKSMDSVYRGVAKGLFNAGGGELRTYGSLDLEVRNQLRVLWKSDFPCHPFSAHPRVPQAAVIQLQKVMHDMNKNAKGMALLNVVNIKGFEASNDAKYDAVRKMLLNSIEVK